MATPLVEEQPKDLLPDISQKETIDFSSSADGCQMTVDVYSPAEGQDAALPLVLAPHPITWTAEQDYHGGLDGLMRNYHRGYYGLAEKYHVLIAMPHGHHHHEDLCSVAGPEQIADMAVMLELLADAGYAVDGSRVYVCGLSMGGHEALVLAGKHADRIAASVAFNPIVDLAAWHEELATSAVPEIREYGTAARIANEVGGTPEEVPELYEERSALHYAEGLAKVPSLIIWTHEDLIVPRQVTHHTVPLYRKVKEIDPNAPFGEYNHTTTHGPIELDQLTRWQLHEWCDYDLAIHWLLNHQQ